MDHNNEKLFEGINSKSIKTWNVNEIADLALEMANYPLINRRVIASYNWDNDSEKPKIMVPGAPKEFYDWRGGDLSEFRGEGRAASKDKNLDAVFTAVRLLRPDFKLSDIDVAANLDALTVLSAVSFQVMNVVWVKSGRPPSALSGAAKIMNYPMYQRKMRIDVEVVGPTILMTTEKPGSLPGYGVAFRRTCSATPPISMQNDFSNGIYKMISEMEIGGLKILLADEVEAACYPTKDEIRPNVQVIVPNDLDVEVVVDGYEGHLDDLTPIAFTVNTRHGRMHPAKWFTQHLSGSSFRYVGGHCKGRFYAPILERLEKIRNFCGLEEFAAETWITVLRCILNEIRGFARECDERRRFAVISDPSSGRLEIHEYQTEAGGGKKQELVSDNTWKYLVSTLDKE